MTVAARPTARIRCERIRTLYEGTVIGGDGPWSQPDPQRPRTSRTSATTTTTAARRRSRSDRALESRPDRHDDRIDHTTNRRHRRRIRHRDLRTAGPVIVEDVPERLLVIRRGPRPDRRSRRDADHTACAIEHEVCGEPQLLTTGTRDAHVHRRETFDYRTNAAVVAEARRSSPTHEPRTPSHPAIRGVRVHRRRRRPMARRPATPCHGPRTDPAPSPRSIRPIGRRWRRQHRSTPPLTPRWRRAPRPDD